MVFSLKDEERKYLNDGQAALDTAQATQKVHALSGFRLNGAVLYTMERHLFDRRKGSFRDVPLTREHWMVDAKAVAQEAISNITSLATQEVQNSPLAEIDIPTSHSSSRRPSHPAFVLRDGNNQREVVVSRAVKRWLDKQVTSFLKYYFCPPINVNHWPGPEMDKIKKERKERKEGRGKERQVINAMEKRLHIQDGKEEELVTQPQV
ncbi:hypothetical protein L486_05591 [Kwoniella mangroviensis CBS 10435]|uniref:Uncharacterized protein n=1 Tax=Kwoniella mangroviensis CBS 10435 TaxID=1331196 RepID=A0A1B9IMJ0_9TREE|nr:hypothetical protein L486_05591 [Kwoniella mangroviensis CBS 10435]